MQQENKTPSYSGTTVLATEEIVSDLEKENSQDPNRHF